MNSKCSREERKNRINQVLKEVLFYLKTINADTNSMKISVYLSSTWKNVGI
jgi:hypothetical protein